MSGVRVVNQRLADLGVTLPQFVRRGEVIAQLPSLALIQLAAETPATLGDEVEYEYVEVSDLGAGDVDELVASGHLDLVGISSYTAMAYDMYALADRFRAAGVPVVLGGLHVSTVPGEAAEHADAICVGEGEPTWPRMLEDFAAGQLSGVYRDPAPGTWDLGRSGKPRFELLEGRQYNRITVQTVRGCPLDCEFCGASKLYGAGYRHKPVDHIVAEIQEVQQRWGQRAFIELADDNSFAHRGRTLALLDRLQGRGIRWFTETDVSIADDDEVLRKLYASGCRQVLIGFESLNPASLDGMDAANWKLKRRERYRQAIDRIQSHGVAVNGCFIVGSDGDGPGVFEELARFIEDSQLLEAQITVLTPFPGTRLLQRLRHEGRLLYDDFWDRCTLFDVVHRPAGMTVQELEEGLVTLMEIGRAHV